MNDTNPMDGMVAAAVNYIIETRRERRAAPYMALLSNIRNVMAQQLDASLRRLVEDGTLVERDTFNQKAYEFNDNHQNT